MKKKLLLLAFIITVLAAVITVHGGHNTLKEAVGDSKSYDVVLVEAGNFTIDSIKLQLPISILGKMAGFDGRNRKFSLKKESVILNTEVVCFYLKSDDVAFDGLLFQSYLKDLFYGF